MIYLFLTLVKSAESFLCVTNEMLMHILPICRIFLQSLLYKQVLESDARSKLANELMLYHMDVSCLPFSTNLIDRVNQTFRVKSLHFK